MDSRQPISSHRAFAIAIAANGLFMLFEILIAFFAHSTSLLADAGHNFSDVLSLGLAWFALYAMQKPSTFRFSYGYKRLSIIATFINGLLLVISSVLIAIHAIEHLFLPTILHEWAMIITALLGIIVNGTTALLFQTHPHDEHAHDLNQHSAYLHLFYDALMSLSVVITGVAIYVTHWFWLDPLMGLLLTGFILRGSWPLFRNAAQQMLDAVPEHIDMPAVEKYLKNISGVMSIHDLHVWGISTREIALTAHLVMPMQTLDDSDHQAIQQTLKNSYGIHHVTLQIEKGDANSPCSNKSCHLSS